MAGRWSLAVASGAGAVAVLVLVAPMALGASTLPPYTGVDSKLSYTGLAGCATEKGKAAFSLTTGTFTGSASSSSKTCPKQLSGAGSYSDGSNTFGTDVAIHLRLPTGFHHVAADWSVKSNLKGAESATIACPAPVPFVENYTYGYGSNQYWDNYSGAQQYCTSDTEAYLSIGSYIDDLTTGAIVNSSYIDPLLSSVNTFNTTYWECYHDTFWNGSGYTYTNGCYGFNQTTSTNAQFGNTYYPTWSGPTSFNNTTTTAFTLWYNNSYSAAHHYAYFFEVDLNTFTDVQGWGHAVATASINLSTLGNSGKLVKIVVS